jgi:predicted transcriptional regulator
LRLYEDNEIKLERLRAKIAEGMASIERGNVIEIDDLDAYFDDLIRRVTERVEQQRKSA